MYEKIVIGIDESYTRTGISIAADGKLLKIASLDYKGLNNKSEKRAHTSTVLNKILTANKHKAKQTIVICERIRTFSGGFLSTNYIKATGALVATIVDVAYSHGVPVFSVDTRSWKAQVVGTAKGSKSKDKQANKMATIHYVKALGHGKAITYKDKKGKVCYNDDAADSACIALYGFIPKQRQALKAEE